MRQVSPFDDTHPDVERAYVRLLRQLPVWRKIEIVDQPHAAAVSLGRAGIRRHHSLADEEEVRLSVAHMFPGQELADRVYGPLKRETDAETLSL
jgi:hypothetical protein